MGDLHRQRVAALTAVQGWIVITNQLGIQRDTSPSPTVGEVRDRCRQLRYGTHRG